jgi:hypothetical protein
LSLGAIVTHTGEIPQAKVDKSGIPAFKGTLNGDLDTIDLLGRAAKRGGNFLKWFVATRGRRIGTSLVALGLTAGVVGHMKFEEVFSPSEDTARPAASAIVSLTGNRVFDASVAKRIADNGATYDANILTLDLERNDHTYCEVPFMVTNGFEGLRYITYEHHGEPAYGPVESTPGQVNREFTQILGSAACKQSDS